MDDMRKLINLIESAQRTQKPIIQESPNDQWQKLFEYNLQATLKNYAPKIISQGIYGVLSGMSEKGAFTEKPTDGTIADSRLSDYQKIAHKLIQAEVHKKFAEHVQSGKVKRFLDSDSIAQVDRAVDAYQGGQDDITLDLNHPHRSMGTYGDPNPDNKDNAPWPGPDGETGGYPPGPPKVSKRGFSPDKRGSIEKHMYNARQTAKDGIPGNTGYLDVQPLGTFSNAGLGRATPLHVWAGSSDAYGNAKKSLVGYRTDGSNFEVNPLFNEIMNDTAFQNKFSTAFMKLLESFDPTPQKRYTLILLKFFLKQEFYMKVGASTDPDIKQPGLVSRPGTITTFPDIEDMRSTHFEDLAWFDQNKHRLPADKRDINQYKSINDFSWRIDSFRDNLDFQDKENPKLDKVKGEYEKIYSSEHGDMYWVKDEEASCYIGQGTRWCTASTESTNYFSEYNAKGPLLIINFKKPTLVATNQQAWQGVDDLGDLTGSTQKVNRVQMNLRYGAGLGEIMQGITSQGVGFKPEEWEDRLTKLPYGTSIKGVSQFAKGDNKQNGGYSYYDKFMYMADTKDRQVWPIIDNPALQQAGIDLSDQPLTLMWQDPKFQSALKQVGPEWNKEMQHPLHSGEFEDEYDMEDAMQSYNNQHNVDEFDDDWEDGEEWGEDGLD